MAVSTTVKGEGTAKTLQLQHQRHLVSLPSDSQMKVCGLPPKYQKQMQIRALKVRELKANTEEKL